MDEEELYKDGPLRALLAQMGKATRSGNKTRWVNSPNVYQKGEVLETGTQDPKKITKWVADGSPSHSTPVKIETSNQFVPTGTNPKEFKRVQKLMKEGRRLGGGARRGGRAGLARRRRQPPEGWRGQQGNHPERLPAQRHGVQVSLRQESFRHGEQRGAGGVQEDHQQQGGAGERGAVPHQPHPGDGHHGRHRRCRRAHELRDGRGRQQNLLRGRGRHQQGGRSGLRAQPQEGEEEEGFENTLLPQKEKEG